VTSVGRHPGEGWGEIGSGAGRIRVRRERERAGEREQERKQRAGESVVHESRNESGVQERGVSRREWCGCRREGTVQEGDQYRRERESMLYSVCCTGEGESVLYSRESVVQERVWQ
jgi:hypothetical protein